jgi:hypothetical protein
VTGIQVGPGLTGIEITNGNIINFSASAISVANGNSYAVVDNITVTGCGQRGIEFVGTVAAPIIESSVTNCTILGTCTVTNADNVITFSNTYDTMFSNCVTATCGSIVATSTLSMVKVVNGFRHQYQNITVMNNTSQFDLRGFSFSNTQSSIFTNCIVNGMVAKGGGSNCQGFVLETNSIGLTGSSISNTFQGCIANALTGTSNVDGFFTGTGNYSNNFFSCMAQNLQVLDVAGVLSGFRFVNTSFDHMFNCYALSCSAMNNNTTAAPLYAAYGFKFDTVSGHTVKQCVANDIYGRTTGAATAGRGVGFFWIAVTTCSTMACTSDRCVFGFDFEAPAFTTAITSNSVTQCLGQKPLSGTNVFNGAPFVAGNSNGANSAATLNTAPTAFPLMNLGIL